MSSEATDYWVCRECDWRSRELDIENIDFDSWAVHCPECGEVIDDRLKRITDILDEVNDREMDYEEGTRRMEMIRHE